MGRRMEGMIWFNEKEKWDAYVRMYIRNAEVKDTSMDSTLRTSTNDVIAKWSIDGHGQVFETRSKERLAQDIAA